MSTLNFPTNPTVGQTYTLGQNVWVWNGSAWIKYTSSTSSPITVTTQTSSTSTNTGAVLINGGAGVNGSVNISSTSTINGADIVTTSTINQYAVTYLRAGTDTAISQNLGDVTIWNTSTLQTITDRGATTDHIVHILNTTESTGTGTGALIVDGGVSVAGRLNAESVKIADTVLDSSFITINNTATVVVDSYSINQFRSAKYLIQLDEGTGPAADFQVIEILLLVDNVGTVYATEYGVLSSNGEMGEFAADVGLDDMVRLYFTAYYATDKNVTVFRTGMTR